MFAPAADATSTQALAFKEFLLPMAAEVRTSLPVKPWGDANVRALSRNTVAVVGTSQEKQQTKESGSPRMSPWVESTLAVIAEQRSTLKKLFDGSDLIKRERIVDSAQMAVSLLSSVSANRRPQLHFTEDNTANFGTSLKDFYINISIEEPGCVTWFADAGGVESFAENVPFDGRSLPQELRRVLSL
jgi:hypothetical protein